MISIIVERAPADRTGDDIVDPLITSEPAARERGRNPHCLRSPQAMGASWNPGRVPRQARNLARSGNQMRHHLIQGWGQLHR